MDFKVALLMADDEILDLRGLKCPLPALFARRALARAEQGAMLKVIADDPLASLDIPHMCAGEGHLVIEMRRDADTTHFILSPRPEAGDRAP
ncbi:MAG TPA: sulfurtransferase TusA family protein [Rhizomicrobium sp.]